MLNLHFGAIYKFKNLGSQYGDAVALEKKIQQKQGLVTERYYPATHPDLAEVSQIVLSGTDAENYRREHAAANSDVAKANYQGQFKQYENGAAMEVSHQYALKTADANGHAVKTIRTSQDSLNVMDALA
ncbi:MAG: hypothetical protein K2X66_08160 [Cyanobacteria bacterium]|nr:hypothetical protein [Cyanobacteriota bacterium]